MSKQEILRRVESFVKRELSGESTGHDWWHTDRVRMMALRIGKEEGADLFVIELAALLHDIDDYKFAERDQEETLHELFDKFEIPEKTRENVRAAIRDTHFRGAGNATCPGTKEGMVLQDADRLDAIGAIGVARVFATGARLRNQIHDPTVYPRQHGNIEEYRAAKGTGTTVTHIHEKLLHLKDRMNTETAKKIAEERHAYIEEFLERFMEEWEGRR